MCPQKDKIHVNVSELLLYLRCPRQVYYTRRGHELMSAATSSYIEHMLVKELALAYHDVINGCTSNNEIIFKQLETEFSRVAGDIELIHSIELMNADTELVKNAKTTVHGYLEEIGVNLVSAVTQPGDEAFRSCITPIRTEPVLHSKRLGLTGIPSKLVCVDNTMMPSVIKTGNRPENGVWKNDRLHIAALAILVEEKYGNPVAYGFVEYARYGLVRKVKIRADDRRQVLKIRNRVVKIKDGVMPERKKSSLCDKCSFSQMCSVKVSLASRFF